MPDLTPAQKLIEKRVLELDAQADKIEARMERGIEKVRETGANHAEAVYRKRWAAKLKPITDEADALRAELPSE